jgi:hypothetical protein
MNSNPITRRREAEAAQQRARITQLDLVHDRYRLAREQHRGEVEQVGGARRVSDAAADPGERAGDGEANRRDRRTGCRRTRRRAAARAGPAALRPRVERRARRARQRCADPGRVRTSPSRSISAGNPNASGWSTSLRRR